jgi:hypothetical protein
MMMMMTMTETETKDTAVTVARCTRRWNPALSIPAKEFEFTDPEVARMKAALQTWGAYAANSDRRWLERSVSALFTTGGA